jgi:hypothetical protein
MSIGCHIALKARLAHEDQSRFWRSQRYATNKKGKSVYQKNKVLLVGAGDVNEYSMR